MKFALALIVCIGLYLCKVSADPDVVLDRKYQKFITMAKSHAKKLEHDQIFDSSDYQWDSFGLVDKVFKKKCIDAFEKIRGSIDDRVNDNSPGVCRFALVILTEQNRRNRASANPSEESAELKQDYLKLITMAKNFDKRVPTWCEPASADEVFKKECIDAFEEIWGQIKEVQDTKDSGTCQIAADTLTKQIRCYVCKINADRRLSEVYQQYQLFLDMVRIQVKKPVEGQMYYLSDEQWDNLGLVDEYFMWDCLEAFARKCRPSIYDRNHWDMSKTTQFAYDTLANHIKSFINKLECLGRDKLSTDRLRDYRSYQNFLYFFGLWFTQQQEGSHGETSR